MRKVAVLLFLLGWVLKARASAPDSTAVYEMKATRIGINTFALQNYLHGADSLNTRQVIRYHLLQDFLYNSALTENHFTKEDYLADIAHNWNFRPDWRVEERFFYQNNRASFTEIGSLNGQLFFTPKVASGWVTNVSAFGGLRRDSRFQRTDTGPEYGGSLNAGWFPADGSEVASVNIFFSQSSLAPRVFQHLVTDARYEKKFNTYATMSVRTEYQKHRTEDYLSENIQRIQSDTLAFFLAGNYTVSDKLSFRSSNQLKLPQRAFSYQSLLENTTAPTDSKYEQYEMETLQEVFYQTDKFRANLQLNYRERDREYANARDNLRDILQSTISWATNFTYLFSETHSLTSQTQAELLRVDTPSEENNEDRDEVYYGSRLFFTSRWTPTFRTSFGLFGVQRQFVFIKAAQSAENYTERSLNYEPGFTWNPGRFSWDAQMQLQANYQVRAQAAEQLKNRSNRTFSQTQLFRYEYAKNLLFQLEYNRRENRLGLLNWEHFTESPLDTTISHTVSFFARKAVTGKRSNHAFRAGYRYFEQRIKSKAGLSSEGQPTTLIYLQNITRQHGPEVVYERQQLNGMRLRASLWLQRMHVYSKYQQSALPYLGLSYSAEELKNDSKNWFPYFDVSMHWALGFSKNRKR